MRWHLALLLALLALPLAALGEASTWAATRLLRASERAYPRP